MRPFEYTAPATEAQAIQALMDCPQDSVILAGGTDLLTLMQRDVLQPKRVVNLKQVESMSGVRRELGGILIGALTTLEDLMDHPLTADYQSLRHVVEGVRAIQVQQNGTLGGDLCLLPNCWYFRNGYGLLGMQDGESLVVAGDNRYHAILGNSGPAKFVNASRLAPALMAWGAHVRVIGPQPKDEMLIPLDEFYVTPVSDSSALTVLKPGQLISHLWLPETAQLQSAAYEAVELSGLDWPLAAAATCVGLEHGVVRQARIVLGHVAPVPWLCRSAADTLVGYPINEETAEQAASIALDDATPLSGNGYKVQIARAAVKRALLRSIGQCHVQPIANGHQA